MITPGEQIKSITELRVDEVSSNDRLRPISDAGVQSLIDSIKDLGVMKDPIQVRKHRTGDLILLAGGHRLEAARRLGWETIPATVWTCNDAWASLMEVDDNLAGSELTSLDQAVFLAERKRIYEREFPGTGHGGDRRSADFQNDMMSFCSATAEKFGISERQVQRIVKAGEGLTPDLVRHLRRGARAPGLSDLQALAGVQPDQRETVVTLFAAGEVKNISAAIDSLKPAKPKPKEQDRQLIALRDAWKRAGVPARREFVAEFRDDLMQGDLSEVWDGDA